jgi:hypothetical protein
MTGRAAIGATEIGFAVGHMATMIRTVEMLTVPAPGCSDGDTQFIIGPIRITFGGASAGRLRYSIRLGWLCRLSFAFIMRASRPLPVVIIPARAHVVAEDVSKPARDAAAPTGENGRAGRAFRSRERESLVVDAHVIGSNDFPGAVHHSRYPISRAIEWTVARAVARTP